VLASFVHISHRKRVVASVIHSLVLDSSDNLIHDCVLRVEAAEFEVLIRDAVRYHANTSNHAMQQMQQNGWQDRLLTFHDVPP